MLCAAAVATVAIAEPVQVVSPNGVTARSYSQDGLMAQWDGEENAGFGLHDSEATVWKNLSSQGTVWDMTNMPNTTYSWEDKRIVLTTTKGDGGIQGAFGVEHADGSLKQIETAGLCLKDGTFFATYPSGSYKWALGNLNSVFWLRESNSDVYQTQPLNVFLCHSFAMADKSADWTLYRNNAVATGASKYCGGLGSVPNTTLIGGVYRCGNPKMNSVRLYSKTLTDGERNLNYAVDQIRFNGASVKTLFSSDDYADSPAVVVIGEPSPFGVSSFPYGVTSFAGSTNGTVTLSGARAYDDGVVAFASNDDPDNLRAICTGWTLKVGTGDPTSGSAASCELGTVTQRALVTWRFAIQHRCSIQSVGGGKVAADSQPSAVSQFYWNGQHGNMTLTAVPDEGLTFICWEGDVDGIADIYASTVQVPNDGSRNLVARFAVATKAVAPCGVTARSYVQKGLDAQWDGAENVAPGWHSVDAPSWRQLLQRSDHPTLVKDADAALSWSDNAVTITAGNLTNNNFKACGMIETYMKFTNVGLFLNSRDPNNSNPFVIGYANSWYYIRGQGKGFNSPTRTVCHTYSCDYSNYKLYSDQAECGEHATGSCWYGVSGNRTLIGNCYSTPKPTIHSLRFYASALSADERQLNYGVDQVRFAGADLKTLFVDSAYDNVKAVAIAGDPDMFGVSSPRYGVIPFESSTNLTVTLSGTRKYDDGVTAYPSLTDPEGTRATYTGYTLKIGSEAAVAGEGTSVELGTVTSRALLVWKFTAQNRTVLSATAGGTVSINGGASGASAVLWSGDTAEVTVRATPTAGYLFSCWTGDIDDLEDDRNATQTLTADAARKLKAVFVKDPALSWNSYAKNGLAAQYDGEFNAIDANGVPYHDSNPSVWQQLVRTSVARNATIEDGKKTAEQAKIVWGEKSVNFTGSGRLLIRGLNSDPGGGDAKGWFSSAYLRACDNIAGVGTEVCAFIPHLMEAKKFAVTANANVYTFGVNYSPNGKGTEWPAMRFGDRGIAEKYTENRGNTNWDISYAQHVRPEGGGTNYVYRNGIFKVKTTNPVIRQYYTSSYLGYFWLGSSNVNLSAFRVYTNTLDTYSIRWNSRVDRIRFLGDSPADVAVDIGSSAHGTCSPALGSSVTVPAGVPYTATLTDAALEQFDDGSCGYSVSETERIRCGWQVLMGGPVPTVLEGDTNVATFTPSNVLNRLEWVFPTQHPVTVSVKDGVGGTVAFAPEVRKTTETEAWADANGTVRLIAAPSPDWQVNRWIVNGEPFPICRPRLEAVVPVDGATTVEVEFERIPGFMVIVR